MSEAGHTRPPDDAPAAALPLDAPDGIATVALPDSRAAAAMADDPLARVIARIALPAVASNLLMTVFLSVDAYWVGTRIGASGLAAVSTSAFWIWMLVSAAEMISVGLTAVASRRHGEGIPDQAARVAGRAVIFALILGAALGAVGLVFLDSLFAVMHTPPDVTAMGRAYLRVLFISAPLLFGYFAVDATFRAAGDTRTPLLLLVVSVALTAVLDPALILGLGPFPKLGITGAAMATMTTRGLAFALGVTMLARRGWIRAGGTAAGAVRTITRIGLPTAATGVIFSVIYVLMTRTVTNFGTPALAALGLGHRVESWLFTIGVGAGTAAAAIVGQNLGAGRADRAARAGWLMVGWTTLPGFVACVAELLVPQQLAAIFTHDPAVIAETARYLRIAAWAQLFIGAELVLEGALGGSGETVPPMLTSTGFTAARIPLAAWAARTFGIVGVWWVISLTACARGAGMMAIWRAGRWRRRRL